MPLLKCRTYFSGGSVDVDVFIAEREFKRGLLARSQITATEVGLIPLVTPEDLIFLKLAAKGRRDMIDVADLLFIQGDLDEKYMKHWGARLRILEALEHQLNHRPTERP